MIALTAPLAQLAAEGADVAGKCDGRTCGGVGVFAVVLMFALLTGGVFMLLQSNFGVLQGYLIAGTAFWASWFVLAIIWFTGVPGVPIDALPLISKGIPQSTPRFTGPQGRLPSWGPVGAVDEAAVAARTDFVPAAGTSRASDIDALKAAENAAAATISERYATELGVNKAAVTVPGTVLVDEAATQLVRSNGVKYIKFTTKAAVAGETASVEEKALITKIKPATFVFQLDKGTEAVSTYIALPSTFLLFVGHLFGLMWYERKHKPVPVSARQREREKVGAL